jgi:hypothetical protein
MGYPETYAKLTRRFGRVRKSAVSNLLPFRKTNRSVVIKTASWASLAVGVAAVGLYVGRELRIRYKFNRRNPIDFFAHAGDELPADYGMGI